MLLAVVTTYKKDAAVLEDRCRVRLPRGRKRPDGKSERAAGGVVNLKTALRHAAAITAGDEHGAVLKERGRVAGARRQQRTRNRPGVGRRVVDFRAGDRRPAATDAARHEHAPVLKHGCRVLAAGEVHGGRRNTERSGAEAARSVEEIDTGQGATPADSAGDQCASILKQNGRGPGAGRCHVAGRRPGAARNLRRGPSDQEYSAKQ